MSVALVTQHAKRMRCVTLSPVTFPVLLYFSTLSHKGNHLLGGRRGGGGSYQHKMSVSTSPTASVCNISHSKKNWARYYRKCSQIFALSASYFCQILIGPRIPPRKSSNIKFHENPSSRSRFVPCGRTDTTKLTVRFLRFCTRALKIPQTSRTAACTQHTVFRGMHLFRISSAIFAII